MVRVLPDVVGAAATVPLTTNRAIQARGWVMLSMAGGAARLGDSTTTISKGIPVAAGGSVTLPGPPTTYADAYVLADLFAYIPAGATATVSYLE